MGQSHGWSKVARDRTWGSKFVEAIVRVAPKTVTVGDAVDQLKVIMRDELNGTLFQAEATTWTVFCCVHNARSKAHGPATVKVRLGWIPNCWVFIIALISKGTRPLFSPSGSRL